MITRLIIPLIMLLSTTAAVTTSKAQSIDDLAARGEAIATADPLAAELRSRQPEGPARRGFDIGLAAAEGQTLPGPSKQKLHDSLAPAERDAFNVAVAYSLERNRNADLAVAGAAIANVDPAVAAARTAEPDVFYWLGFDIATGIFGDRSQGGRGNTATGPNSLKIRDSLSVAGQRGFNASVKFHLNRNRNESAQVTSVENSGKRNPDIDKALILRKRVPAIVGLKVWEAESKLSEAGFKYKEVNEDEFDPTVLIGHVRASVPAANSLLDVGEVVELHIPRGAIRVGIGILATTDVARRDGFDLDEGRYEEIYRGADIVLREQKTNDPYVDPSTGRTYYSGAGLYLEPSDGAVLATIDNNTADLSSYVIYQECKRALEKPGKQKLQILAGAVNFRPTICVLTSKRQVAALYFRDTDNVNSDDFKFHHALFPRQVEAPTSDSIRSKDKSVRDVLTPKKPD